MESCSCAHEQQVRHLKSRVSQLEIMFDKAQKRINTLSQVSASTGSSPPTHTQVTLPRAISLSDVRRSEEYKRLQADLESEKRVKMDLMANLKELTTTNEAAQARLVQEIEELKAQHETTMTGMDEVQEEFERMRIIYDLDSQRSMTRSASNEGQGVNSVTAAEGEAVAVGGHEDGRISASIVRSFATQLDRVQEQRVRLVLQNIVSACPEALRPSEILQDNEALEAQVLSSIDKLKHGYINDASLQALKDLWPACQKDFDASNQDDLDVLVQRTSLAVLKRLELLENTRDTLVELLYRRVPATFADFYTLFARAASFTYPDMPTKENQIQIEDFELYLRTIGANLSHTIRKYISAHQKSRQKLSYRSFAVGDLALFLPTRNNNSPAWAAFNVGAPHYFLAMEGIETDNRDFLIGRIQEIIERNGESGSDAPPHIAGLTDVRKWYEVKIQEKKRIGHT